MKNLKRTLMLKIIKMMTIPKRKKVMNQLMLKMLKQLKQIYLHHFLKKLVIYQYLMMNLILILKVVLKFLVMKWIQLMLIWHTMH